MSVWQSSRPHVMNRRSKSRWIESAISTVFGVRIILNINSILSQYCLKITNENKSILLSNMLRTATSELISIKSQNLLYIYSILTQYLPKWQNVLNIISILSQNKPYIEILDNWNSILSQYLLYIYLILRFSYKFRHKWSDQAGSAADPPYYPTRQYADDSPSMLCALTHLGV